MPLVGTIAAVTFLGGYVPYIGAWAAMFGAVGLILAAPLTSAIVRISADFTESRAEAAPTTVERGPPVAAT